MKYKHGQVIKVNGEVPLMNPEDWFNDMIEDGIPLEQALDHVITDCIVMSKVNDMLSDTGQDELFGNNQGLIGNNSTFKQGGGMFEVLIEDENISWEKAWLSHLFNVYSSMNKERKNMKTNGTESKSWFNEFEIITPEVKQLNGKTILVIGKRIKKTTAVS